MVKGVIMQVNGWRAVLLGDDGRFHTIINRRYQVGQELHGNRGTIPVKKLAVAASLLVALAGGSALAYWTPVRYATVDINPSIMLDINLFNRVIGATGVNEDGVKLLENIHTTPSLSQNIHAIVRQAAAEGYLTSQGNNAVMITITGNGSKDVDGKPVDDDELADAQEEAEEALDEAGTPGEVVAERVGYNRVQEARKLGTTPGKLNLVQKLIASSPEGTEIDVNEWLNKPVKDIMKAIKANRKNGSTETASPTGAPTDSIEPTPSGSGEAIQTHGKPEKTMKPEKTLKPGKTSKPEKTMKPEKTPKPTKTAKPEKTPKPDKTMRPANTNNR